MGLSTEIDYEKEVPIYDRLSHRFIKSNYGVWIRRDDLIQVIQIMLDNPTYQGSKETLEEFKTYLNEYPKDVPASYWED